MQKQKLINSRVLLSLSALLLTPTTYAAYDTPNAGDGFYLGAELGYSANPYTQGEFAIPVSGFDNSGFAQRIFLGYDVNRYFGLDLGMTYLYQPVIQKVPGATRITRIRDNLLGLSAKISYPVHERISLFAKLGIGYASRPTVYIQGEQLLRGGELLTPQGSLGISYQVYGGWHVNALWQYAPKMPKNKLPEKQFYGFGFFYHF